MNSGVLVDWNDERGFGFVEADAGRLFVHISAFPADGGRPQPGDPVRFEVGSGPDRRMRAVRAVRATSPTRWRVRVQPLPLAVTLIFLVTLASLIAVQKLPLWLGAVYLVASVTAYALYAADKRRAIAGSWRISEMTLQVVAMLGGWPGAVLAQQLLRHKSSKRSFQLVFWMCVAVNLVLLTITSRPQLLQSLTDWLG